MIRSLQLLRRPLRMVGTFVALNLGWSGIVWACSCALPETATEKLDASNAVFLGTVESSRPIGCHFFVQSSMDQTKTKFTVTEGFKSASDGETVEILHATEGASCGVEFNEGESWLIFAREDGDGGLTTGLCDGNGLEADAADDLTELRGSP